MAEPAITCAGCALLCDDVHVGADGTFAPECALGAAWWAGRDRGADAPEALVDGAPTSRGAAVAAAARRLHEARRPLLHGFAAASTEDARAAAALADRIGAAIVPGDLRGDWPAGSAASLRGTSTATLGEIRDRAALIVIWREDPVRTHPRLLERLRVAGDGTRLCVLDDRDTATADAAELRLRWPAHDDLAALSALAVLARGRTPGPGAPEPAVNALRDALRDAGHVAFVHGRGLSAGPGGERRVLALHELVRALSDDGRAVSLALPAAPGPRGAQDVVCWQTGYSGIVNLRSGHPELAPATILDEADLLVGVHAPADPVVTPGGDPPRIALGGDPDPDAAVWLAASTPGLTGPGTAHRLDGVPLTLQTPAPDGRPAAAQLLTALVEAIA